MSDEILTNVNGAIEIQEELGIDARVILDLRTDIQAALTGLNKSLGDITRNYRISAATHNWVPRPVRRSSPTPAEPEIAMPLTSFNALEAYDENSRLGIYARNVTRGDNVGAPLTYSRIDILVDAAISNFDLGDLTISDGDEEDRMLTVPFNCADIISIWKMTAKQNNSSLSSADDCDATVIVEDYDGSLFIGTSDDSVDGYPYLVYSTDKGANWTEVGLTTLGANSVDAMIVAGDYLIVAAGTSINVYTKAGVLVSTYTASAAITALGAATAAHIYAAGAGGLLLYSNDGGASFTAATSGTANALGSMHVRGLDDVLIGGAAGTLIWYYRGTCSTISLPAGLAAVVVNSVGCPYSPAGFNRDETIYLGMANGTVYRTVDQGDNWEQVPFPGDDAGAVVDVGFIGFMGQVLYVLHTPVAGSSKLWRDFSGGAGGNANMESISVPTNSGLNAMVISDPNAVWAVGDVHSAAEMIIEAERQA